MGRRGDGGNFRPIVGIFTKCKIALLWNDRDVDGDDQFTCEHNYIIIQASNKSPILSRLAGYLLIPSFLRSIIIFFPINKLSLKMLLLV